MFGAARSRRTADTVDVAGAHKTGRHRGCVEVLTGRRIGALVRLFRRNHAVGVTCNPDRAETDVCKSPHDSGQELASVVAFWVAHVVEQFSPGAEHANEFAVERLPVQISCQLDGRGVMQYAVEGPGRERADQFAHVPGEPRDRGGGEEFAAPGVKAGEFLYAGIEFDCDNLRCASLAQLNGRIPEAGACVQNATADGSNRSHFSPRVFPRIDVLDSVHGEPCYENGRRASRGEKAKVAICDFREYVQPS